jgi:hypothetical protein
MGLYGHGALMILGAQGNFPLCPAVKMALNADL